jgi:protein-S-isoprenylcysteine O-methyltransferase Ste14
MSPVLALLLLIDLGLIGLLPRLFFRRGKLGLSWWLTASPFFVATGIVLAAAVGLIEPRAPEHAQLRTALELAATILSAVSIALIAMTIGTHRRSISLWHQRDDAPANIVTEGPYARIRHPFYAAFLLALLAVVIAAPHVASLFVLIYGFVALSLTAAREERRLCASDFGEEYREYMDRTGRFHPRLRGLLR